MESFFEGVVRDRKLRLPTGEVLEDTAILPDFCKSLGLDHAKIWDSAMARGSWGVEEELERGDGWNPRWVPGGNRALRYRGNAIAREKIWLQSGFDDGMARYGYTGWQWRVAPATARIESIPEVEELAKRINDLLSKEHNHWILTRYAGASQNIGFHSDKMGDWAAESCFVVVKFGEARKFEFSWEEPELKEAERAVKSAEKSEDAESIAEAKAARRAARASRRFPEVFYSELLQPGTAVVVGARANARVRHGVPVAEGEAATSGSIVGRCIERVFSWGDVDKKIAARQPKNL